ncbi:hypothetical protein G3T36_07615 [Diaminobutyricibacter tongyongensis]|uniref:DUF3892 domain-containing protein n=1 Tax=Leifsonia tongyongensis TaxID=1268043 RepID=A0A6L9XXK7_9MICO|nr:hypothetical protein [Diaminobutyricibacter tongyongensis]NEN05738.1 hypothetical protein [Diaminobutyricibacter tongyongensis]
MPDLKIELVARNELGSIVALITPHGVVDASVASTQIMRGEVTYVTGPDSFVRVPVRSISALGGPYLYANWDGSQRNNLQDLAAVRVRTIPAAPPAGFSPAGPSAAGFWMRWRSRLICRLAMIASIQSRDLRY